MWKVTRLDDGSYLAECERCAWRGTYRAIGRGTHAASLHYASHRGTPDRGGNGMTDEQMMALNDTLTRFALEHGIKAAEDVIDNAVWAAVNVIEAEGD